MIAKEYTNIINEYFRKKFNKGDITFINKESAVPSDIKFGDMRLYKIEIWMVNFVTNKKELVFAVCDNVMYKDKELKKTCQHALLTSLWLLTLNNMNEIDKYGVQ